MAFDRNDPAYEAYIRILEAELIPATGCTEPIAIAYGAAKARQVLGALPERWGEGGGAVAEDAEHPE